MTAELGIRMKAPPHVGGFVKHEILAHLELTVTDAAKSPRRNPTGFIRLTQ